MASILKEKIKRASELDLQLNPSCTSQLHLDSYSEWLPSYFLATDNQRLVWLIQMYFQTICDCSWFCFKAHICWLNLLVCLPFPIKPYPDGALGLLHLPVLLCQGWVGGNPKLEIVRDPRVIELERDPWWSSGIHECFLAPGTTSINYWLDTCTYENIRKWINSDMLYNLLALRLDEATD